MELWEGGSSQLRTEHHNIKLSSLQQRLTVTLHMEHVLSPGEEAQQHHHQAEAEHDHGEATPQSHLG